MSERRGRERLFEIDPVKRPQRPFWRLIISKYVGWVQAFGYVFCAAVTAGIVVCWIVKTDEVAREKDVDGISRDSLKSHQTFIAKQDLPFRLLSDPECTLLKPLGAFGKKIMYGKEVEGIIRSTFLVDPKGIIRHIWPKVSVKGHVGAVIEALADLQKS